MDKLVIHCKDLKALCQQVLETRNLSDDCIMKLGVDGGGGFLKVSFGFMEKVSVLKSPPPKRLLTNSLAKDSGVKRQLLIAISEDLQENYSNAEQVFDLLNIEKLRFIFSCDMKLANIICGLQASAHSCSWCDISSKDLAKCGSLKTFGSIRRDYQAFIATDANIKKASLFRNSVHEPIINASDASFVLDVLPLMELHLLLGVVNHLLQPLSKIWKHAPEWLALLHIQQQPFHGGQLAGNECRKLLKNVDVLKRLAQQHSFFPAVPFIDTLRKFNGVVHACFGNTLDYSYAEKIEQFRVSYLQLQGTTITPKVHAVIHHVPQFIQRHNSSLGIYSEQATEALHHLFRNNWQRFKRPRNQPRI